MYSKPGTPIKKSTSSSSLQKEISLDDIMKMLKSMQSSQDTKFKAIQDKFVSYENKLSILNNSFESMVKSFNNLLSENKILKDELNNLRDRISLLESTKSSINIDMSSSEVIREAQLRISKSKNVVIFNMEESPNETNDISKALASDLISHLNLDLNIILAKRLGKAQSNKRPLLVQFGNESEAFTLIKNKLKLQNTIKWKNIWINADLTLLQRSQMKSLREELLQRRLKGESNIVIGYIKGIPSIQPKN